MQDPLASFEAMLERRFGLAPAPLTSSAPSPSTAASRKAVGLACAVLPEELPHALGLDPVRLVLAPDPPKRSSAHLQSFACAWAQALLDQAMAGRLSTFAGLVLPCNTCDSLQNLPDLLTRAVPGLGQAGLFSLRLPATDSRAAPRFLEAELGLFTKWLERLAGATLDPARLAESARLFNRLRALLRRLHALALEGQLLWSDLHAATTAAQTQGRELVALRLEAALERGPSARPDRTGGSIPIALVGGVLDDDLLLRLLEERGATLVADDTCALERSFAEEMDLDPSDPLADLARRQLRRSPCPGRLGSAEERTRRLLARVASRGARGVIFIPTKGCDPHAFDNVLIKEALDLKGIPNLTVEVEPHLGSLGPLATRMEAFLEMLGGEEVWG